MHDRRRVLVAGLALAVTGLFLAACTSAAPAAQPSTTTTHALPTPTPSPTPPPEPPNPYPGAAWLVESGDGGELLDVPYTPQATVAAADRPVTYETGCHTRTATLQHCEFGPVDAPHTIVLTGDSHSANWLPALQAIADELGFHIVSVTKSGCRFAVSARWDCQTWNTAAWKYVAELKPDLILTLATVGSGGSDYFYTASIPAWRAMEEAGIPVIALRDVAWLGYSVPLCVLSYGPDDERCGADRAAHGLRGPIVVPAGQTLPSNVHLLDLSYLFCDATLCPAVVGNVLVYRDNNHITKTYSATAGPYLGQHILDIMGWSRPAA